MATEAQSLVRALLDAGMQRVDIARQAGVTASVIRDLERQRTKGDTHLDKLRSIAAHVAGTARLVASPGGAPGNAPGDDQGGVNGPGAAPTVSLDVADLPADERTTVERIRDSIKSAMFNPAGAAMSVSAPQSKPREGKTTDAQARFVDDIAPIVAIIVCILLEVRIPRPYRALAMTTAEAEGISRPLLRILARQLAVAGKLSDNMIDLLAALGASAIYLERVYETFKVIREAQQSYVEAGNGYGPQSYQAPQAHQNGYSASAQASAAAGAAGGGAAGPVPVPVSQAVAAGLVTGAAGAGGAGAPAASNGHHGGAATHYIAAQPGARAPGATTQQGGRDRGKAPGGHDAPGGDAIERVFAADAVGRFRLGLN